MSDINKLKACLSSISLKFSIEKIVIIYFNKVQFYAKCNACIYQKAGQKRLLFFFTIIV